MISEKTYEQQVAVSDRPRLVVADDDTFVCSMLASQLDAWFECVGAAADADEAIALVVEHRPDVAILDVNMPGGGAMHATREIRALSPETAIVILSGDEVHGEVVELLSAGAIAYLRKGIDPHSLGHKLIASINAHRRAAQRQNSVTANVGVRDPTGKPSEIDAGPLVSSMIDEIPDRQQIERVAAHFAAVVESFDDAIIGQHLDGIVTSWNQGAERLYGYTEAEMQGKAGSVLVPPGDDDDLPQILGRLRAGERIDEYEAVRVRNDGTMVNVSLTVSPLRSGDGTVIGASTIARDITSQVRHQEQLLYLAEHDALTGTRNRRRFDRDLNEQIGRARRYGEKSALLMIDINGFKQINDTHSHKTGDKALKAVGAALMRRLRSTDVVARIGGDEFTVLLPYAGASQAQSTSEALRQIISDTSIELDNGAKLSLSASIGTALIDANTDSDDAVLAEADRAMYQDKARQAQPAKCPSQ